MFILFWLLIFVKYIFEHVCIKNFSSYEVKIFVLSSGKCFLFNTDFL